MNIIFSSQRPTRNSGVAKVAKPFSDLQIPTLLSRIWESGKALLFLFILLGLVCGPVLRAQVTAQLSGSVQDSSGGVIPGAQVTLVNQATGDTRVVDTNSVGLYTFVALLPSSYSIQVVAKGFQPKQLTGVVLHAGDSLAVPTFVMAVGSTTQTVQVQAAPQIIPTDNGERADILDSRQIENLALQGRDATELLKVLPGATTQSGGLTQVSPMFSDLNVSANESSIGGGINLNGVPNRGGTELLSDGVDVLDPGDEAGSISMISPEMTQEVSVQTSNFGADSQYGPVVVSAISKSGTANYHGEAYFDARNDVLNANDWQDNHQGVAKGDAHYYYPGGNFGGPVPLTDKKLFFWGGYERFLQNQGNANVLKSYIPTPEMMAGDFTSDNADNNALCPGGFSAGVQGQWCNDLSGTTLPDGSSPTPAPPGETGATIPSQFLDPGAKAMASFWPKANANPATTPSGYNYYQPVDNINNGWIYRLRVDYNMSDNTKFYISYQQAYSAQLAQGNGAHIYWTPGNSIPFPGGGVYGYAYTKALAGHFVHTFSPTATNEFIASWGFGNFPFGVPNASAAYKSTLGYPSSYGTVFNAGSKLIPSYSSGGTNTFPDFSQADIFENPVGVYEVRKEVPAFSDNFTKVWGAHTIKMGAYTQNTGNIQSNDGTNINGDITSFSGQNANAVTGINVGSPNNPVANFIIGNVTGYQENSAAPVSDMAYQATAVFVDDSWRFNSRLNFELGARIEHVGHWYDRQGTGMAAFFPDRVLSDYNSGKIAPGYYWHGIDPGIPLSGQPNRFAFVSPRFGMAYDVFGTGNTVIRGGWGAYRFTGQYNDYAAALTTAQNVRTYNLPGQKTVLLSQIGQLAPAACSTQCSSGSQNGLDATDYGEPLTYAYNLTIDQRLKWNSLLDVAYVGSSTSQILDDSETIEGSDFTALADQNKTPIGAFFKPDPVTGNPSSTNPENQSKNADGTATGNKVADYHPFGYAYGTGTAVMAQSSGYTNYNGLQVAWLKSAGRLTYDFNFTWSKTLGTGLQANPYDIHANYGVEAIDRPYVFNASYTYQTGSFDHGNALVRGAVGGWTISGISTWQAGGSLLALLGNGVPNFGLSESYASSSLPPNASANGITSGVSTATYYGTDETGLAIQPVLTCNPNGALAKYQRVQLKCFAAPAIGTYGGQNYPYMSMGSYFDNDLALYKSFHVKEQQTVQFRISAFNWLNHPLPEFSSSNQVTLRYLVDYPSKNITLNTGSGGTVSNFGFMDTKTQAPYSRILELNVKYNF
jgi:hypothetical protein